MGRVWVRNMLLITSLPLPGTMSMNSMDEGGCLNKICRDTQHSVATVHSAIGTTLINKGLIDAI